MLSGKHGGVVLQVSHPRFHEYQSAIEKLRDATEAAKKGGSKLDVSMATMELNQIKDEIGDA